MEKRKIVFYLTIGMILILHLTACTNRSSELPAPDSTVFGYEGETKIIFDGVCAKYNDKKEKNQVFLPIVQVLGTYGQYILGKPANGLGNRAIYQPAAS